MRDHVKRFMVKILSVTWVYVRFVGRTMVLHVKNWNNSESCNPSIKLELRLTRGVLECLVLFGGGKIYSLRSSLVLRNCKKTPEHADTVMSGCSTTLEMFGVGYDLFKVQKG